MTQEDIRKQLLKYGALVGYEGPKKKKRTKVKCEGCGKDIFSDDPGILGAVITKRGTAYFWHDKCGKKVWNSKITT